MSEVTRNNLLAAIGMIMIVLLVAFCGGCSWQELVSLPINPDTPIHQDTTVTDPNDTITNPVDTIISPPDSIVLPPDSCTQYIGVASPDFVNFYTNKDVLPDPVYWFYNNEPIEPNLFFAQFGILNLYLSGINKGGTLTGNVTAAQFQGRIKCGPSMFGPDYMMVFYDQGLTFHGATTFDQYLAELVAHPQFEGIMNFANSGFTLPQVLSLFDFMLADCKAIHATIWLKFLPFTIPQDYIDALEDHGATIVF